MSLRPDLSFIASLQAVSRIPRKRLLSSHRDRTPHRISPWVQTYYLQPAPLAPSGASQSSRQPDPLELLWHSWHPWRLISLPIECFLPCLGHAWPPGLSRGRGLQFPPLWRSYALESTLRDSFSAESDLAYCWEHQSSCPILHHAVWYSSGLAPPLLL